MHLGWEERAKREVRNYRDYVRRYTPRQFREREPTGG
jgi:hypothetical protein